MAAGRNMADGLKDSVVKAAEARQRPDGSPYRSLSYDSQKAIAEDSAKSHKAVQLAALKLGIVPEVYARNQKSLSSEDQVRLLQSRVVVVGLGGLGGTVTEILARVGIGNLTLIDGDRFDDSNLNRQLLSSTAVLGREKADVAAERVGVLNPAVEVRSIVSFLSGENATDILAGSDIAVDCLDSITDRFTLEQACRRLGVPLVSAAIGGTSGQLSVIYPEDQGLKRIYGDPSKAAHRGVEKQLGTLPFTAIALAAMECAEVVIMALGKQAALKNKMLITDLFDHSLEVVDLGQ